MKKRILSGILSAVLCACSPTVAFAAPDYSSKDVIMQVQEALNFNGFDCGTPDGIAGSGTNGAVQSYRAENGLPEGGIDQELIDSLGLSGYPFFFPATDEEKSALDGIIEDSYGQIESVLKEIGAFNSEATSLTVGNYSTVGQLIVIDAKYEPSNDRALLVNCMYVPGENPPWSVNYVRDKSTGDYYYLSPDREGIEDVVPYPGSGSEKTENDSASESSSESSESIHVEFYSSVNNDVTGKWRMAIVNTNYPVSSYLVNYYKTYFGADDEIHAVINRNDNTTTRLAVYGSMIDVTTLRYIPGEENDANLLFGGDMISDQFFDKTTGEVLEF